MRNTLHAMAMWLGMCMCMCSVSPCAGRCIFHSLFRGRPHGTLPFLHPEQTGVSLMIHRHIGGVCDRMRRVCPSSLYPSV